MIVSRGIDISRIAPEVALENSFAETIEEGTSKKLNGRPSIILVAPPRTGKSIIADRLKQQFGYKIIRIDELRWKFIKEYSKPEWKRLAHPNLSNLISGLKTGHVIEGDDLLDFFETESEQDYVTAKDDLFADVVPIFLGAASESPEEKCQSILSYREKNYCWTRKQLPTVAEVMKLARHLTKMSKRSRLISEQRGLQYFEIRSASFNDDIQSVVDFVSEHARADGNCG